MVLKGLYTFIIAIILAGTSPPRDSRADGCLARTVAAATIPFQLIGNHIYVNAIVDGMGPYRFIVDTGGVNLIDASLVKPLSLKITGKEPGRGVGPQMVESGKTIIDHLTLGGHTFRQQKFYTFDFKQLYPGGGVEMMGMIGTPLFRRYVTCIDFNDQVIDLMDPSRFDPSQAGERLPILIRDNVVTVHGSFDGLPGTFQIDTGSSTTLTLYAPFVAQHNFLVRFPRQVKALDNGVGGASPIYVVRGRNLVLGTERIEHPITSLAIGTKGQLARTDISGNVGIGAMKRYVVTFDFAGESLFLKPYQPAPTDVDNYDRSGMQIEAEPTGFRVVSVAESTPAANAGIRPGDLIVAVDGKPATSITLPTMREDLRQWSAGSIVHLEVKSGDKLRSVRVQLRDLL